MTAFAVYVVYKIKTSWLPDTLHSLYLLGILVARVSGQYLAHAGMLFGSAASKRLRSSTLQSLMEANALSICEFRGGSLLICFPAR